MCVGRCTHGLLINLHSFDPSQGPSTKMWPPSASMCYNTHISFCLTTTIASQGTSGRVTGVTSKRKIQILIYLNKFCVVLIWRICDILFFLSLHIALSVPRVLLLHRLEAAACIGKDANVNGVTFHFAANLNSIISFI